MYYKQQANNFCQKYGIRIIKEYFDYNYYFDDDKEKRDIYKIIIKSNKKQMTFKFGQSIAERGIEPDNYTILTCLEKYGPEDFDSFCNNYGYNNDSRKAHQIYLKVTKQYKDTKRVFSHCLEELREIC